MLYKTIAPVHLGRAAAEWGTDIYFEMLLESCVTYRKTGLFMGSVGSLGRVGVRVCVVGGGWGDRKMAAPFKGTHLLYFDTALGR